MAVLGAAIVVVIEHFVLHASWPVAAFLAVIVAISSVAWAAWRESKRAGTAAAVPPRRRVRRR